MKYLQLFPCLAGMFPHFQANKRLTCKIVVHNHHHFHSREWYAVQTANINARMDLL